MSREKDFTATISKISKANFFRAPILPAKSIHPLCAPAPRRPARKQCLEFRPQTKPLRRKRNARPTALFVRRISKIFAPAATCNLFPAESPAPVFYLSFAPINFLRAEIFGFLASRHFPSRRELFYGQL